MVADGCLGVRPVLFEPGPISRDLAGSRVGTGALRGGPGVDVSDLSRNVVQVVDSAILLPVAPHQHNDVRVHADSFDGSDLAQRWCHLAGDEVSAGGVAQGGRVNESVVGRWLLVVGNAAGYGFAVPVRAAM